ncbi:MAG: hypothetical protein GY937_27375 [bacterium]|nr:hypothetical protein [bacterium]
MVERHAGGGPPPISLSTYKRIEAGSKVFLSSLEVVASAFQVEPFELVAVASLDSTEEARQVDQLDLPGLGSVTEPNLRDR